MTSIASFNKIDELDLDSVKVKLMHHSGEGWTRDRADAVETEYRRFLFLMVKFPHEKTAPRVDVDTFWHYHILDTLKYAADCDKAFGHFLHHDPSVGMEGENAAAEHQGAGQRMRELYEQTFGCSYDAAPAYCSIVVPPAKPARSATASAYCSIHPPMRSGDTAYCSIHPPVQSAAAGATAYCSNQPPVASHEAQAATAYCSIHPPLSGQASGTAYCSIHPPVSGAIAKTAAPALA